MGSIGPKPVKYAFFLLLRRDASITSMARTLYPWDVISAISFSLSSPYSNGVNLLKSRVNTGTSSEMSSIRNVTAIAKSKMTQSPKAQCNAAKIPTIRDYNTTLMIRFLIISLINVFFVLRLNPYFCSITKVSYISNGMDTNTDTTVLIRITLKSCIKSV